MRDHTLPLFSLQEETREIPLTRGKVAIVDAADYEWLMQWKWHAAKTVSTWYARRSALQPDGSYRSTLMHREILRAAKDVTVDHKDGNGLNNTRGNLRQCTDQQNSFNRAADRDSTSPFKGVSWKKSHNVWQAGIKIEGKYRYIGHFTNPIDAARAYDAVAKEAFGEFARLNFVDDAALSKALEIEPVGLVVRVEHYHPSLAELIAEVRRQSVGGAMPSMTVFDLARPAMWTTARAQALRFELSWTEIADLAGLEPNANGKEVRSPNATPTPNL